MRTISAVLLTALLVGGFSAAASADETGWKTLGLRGGLSTMAEKTFYHEYEAFAVYRLPWSWRSSGGLGVSTQIDSSLGMVRGQGTNAFIGTVGPDFAFDKKGFPVELEAGLNFAFLSTPDFGTESFEGGLSFVSHVGLNFRPTRMFGVGFRFQHMSNGDIYGGRNPGLNLLVLSLNFYPKE